MDSGKCLQEDRTPLLWGQRQDSPRAHAETMRILSAALYLLKCFLPAAGHCSVFGGKLRSEHPCAICSVFGHSYSPGPHAAGTGAHEQGRTAGSKSAAWLQVTLTLQPHFSPGSFPGITGCSYSAGAQQVFSIKDRQREASAS